MNVLVGGSASLGYITGIQIKQRQEKFMKKSPQTGIEVVNL